MQAVAWLSISSTAPGPPGVGPGGLEHLPRGVNWVGTFTGIAVLTVVVFPLAVLAACALARRRQRAGAMPAWAWRASVAEVGILWWTVPLVAMTMLPGSEAGRVPGRVSLVPFQDMVTTPISQVVGNLLLLAALGALGPVRFAALASLPRIVALAAACSITIEVAQYVLQLDRVSSVDDVLLNTTGAALAALASRPWWRTPAAGVGRTAQQNRVSAHLSRPGAPAYRAGADDRPVGARSPEVPTWLARNSTSTSSTRR
jgi:hypothetical protein